MELSVQTFENFNEKKAIEFINNIEQFVVVYSSLKSKNTVRKKSIVVKSPNLYIRWTAKDKLLIMLKTDNVLPTGFEIKSDSFMSEEYKRKSKILENYDFYHIELKEELERSKYNEVLALKKIYKASDKSFPFKTIRNFLNLVLENQDENEIKDALIIEEKRTKHIWFIYKFKNGFCDCFANLNNNEFAEFGSVRFSDISSAFKLDNGFDDVDFRVDIIKINKELSFYDIRNYCKR